MTSGKLLLALCGGLVLSACGGGGGGSPPPAPPPNPPPVTDTTPPDTTLATTTPALTNQATANFTATSSENGSTLEGSLDGAAFAAITSPHALNGLAEGEHTLQVRARDAAGNVDATPASFTWRVDLTPPDTTISAAPPALYNSRTANFGFSSEANATFEVFTNAGYVPSGPTYQDIAQIDGTRGMLVRARDAAGNVDPTPAEYLWRIDTTAPAARILFPSAVAYSDAANITVRGSTIDDVVITGITVNGVNATTSDNYASWMATVPLAAGDNAITVSTTDELGNTNTNAASASVANRGPVLYDVTRTAWDAANQRLLAYDAELGAIIALRASDGRASIFSDDTHGSGPSPANSAGLVIDAANNRALMMATTGEVMAVNLTNGNRTLINIAPYTMEFGYFADMACVSPCSLLYVAASPPDPVAQSGMLYTINLVTGARTHVSGGVFNLGAGLRLFPNGIALDSSTGTLRALLTQSGSARDAVYAVNLANGDRTLVSSATDAVGSGTAFENPNGISLGDGARAYVADNVGGYGPGRVMAVDLANGNRSIVSTLTPATAYRYIYGPQWDTTGQRIFVTQFRPAGVAQVRVSTSTPEPFADNSVGSGPGVAGGSVLLDPAAGSSSLLTSGYGEVVRVLLNNGIRTRVADATFTNGAGKFIPQHLAFDTRAGAPPNSLLMGDSVAIPFSLYSADYVTGTRTLLSSATVPYTGTTPDYPLDASNGRLLISLSPSFNRFVIQPMDVATGTLGALIADSNVGTPSFYWPRALAIQPRNGASSRLLAFDLTGTLLAIDLTSGARGVISSSTVGSGPVISDASSLAVDSANDAAFLVNPSGHAVYRIDLQTGARTLVSGPGRGIGPRIASRDGSARLTLDPERGVAYVSTNGDSILTVDLVTGNRVLTAR